MFISKWKEKKNNISTLCDLYTRKKLCMCIQGQRFLKDNYFIKNNEAIKD